MLHSKILRKVKNKSRAIKLSSSCCNSVLQSTHVRLAALTTYNPALLALNDMMKQQVELSRQFLSMQQEMHKSIMGSIERGHTYTTLEDTNQVP